MKQQILDIYDALVDEHGHPDPPRDLPPVDYLIHTILSQNTTNENRDAAFDELKATFGDNYDAIEHVPHDELVTTIQTAGLANQKTSRIQSALRTVREHTGGDYDLTFIADMDADEAQNWLTDIKGIGPKTASLILLFRFDKPLFPVDTHCERVGKRFGLIPEDMSAARAHVLMREHVPDDIKYELHHLLVTHGREYCTARNPRCKESTTCQQFCSNT